ncbi:unnamed protein product [Zymoseptoria tritici ST99CH_3D7]|uniref:Uncharacterized protein n=1 Tax=Zymoseptoria tritici (strain ST99CH_3D7) TaxID=1276538 RepID=A0A1X7RPQ7_ZYMT9|nr:unnamed protein product [Zymoseptoria tritici ST99CH_3D7]
MVPRVSTGVGEKRAEKLRSLLRDLRHRPTPSKDGHNGQVESLWSGPRLPVGSGKLSGLGFATILGHLSRTASSAATVYGLLSWRVFGLEESHLIEVKNVAPNLAAKQMNQEMCKVFQRGGKTKDWASDARRAAKMVFYPLENAGAVEQTFALLLLSDACSLDSLLKVAHFPSLRREFQREFASIVASRSAEWQRLHALGYALFRYHTVADGALLPGHDKPMTIAIDSFGFEE